MTRPDRGAEATAVPSARGDARPSRRWIAAAAPVAIFAALALMFAFALKKGDPSKVPSALIGKQAPALALPPVEGLVDASGRPLPGLAPDAFATGAPTVVNFWASWCLPCVEEHPLLVQLIRQTGVRLIGINHKDQAVNAVRFLTRHGNPFAAVGADGNGRAAIEWGVYGMPETFVVDGRGLVAFKHVGPLTAESIEQRLLPAIARAKAAR